MSNNKNNYTKAFFFSLKSACYWPTSNKCLGLDHKFIIVFGLSNRLIIHSSETLPLFLAYSESQTVFQVVVSGVLKSTTTTHAMSHHSNRIKALDTTSIPLLYLQAINSSQYQEIHQCTSILTTV